MLNEPSPATDVALRRDESGDRTELRNRSGVIDALRAIAALMVLTYHTSELTGTNSNSTVHVAGGMLAAGVYLFFVVSGYLIAGPFLRALVNGRPLPAIGHYAVRRIARIYPAYWVAFGAVLLLLWPQNGIRPYQFPVHLLLLQSSWPHVAEPSAIFGPAWTLGVEIAFYVLVPVAASLLRAVHPRPWRPEALIALVMLAALASVGWTYFVYVDLGSSVTTMALAARIGLQMWLFMFCPGMVIALGMLMTNRGGLRWPTIVSARKAVILPIAIPVLWVLAYLMSQSSSPWIKTTGTPTYIVACGLIVGWCVAADPWRSRLVRLLAPIGVISYGIYLWHFIVIELVLPSAVSSPQGPAAWLGYTLLVFAITVPLATISWFAIERPLMRRAATWSRSRRSAPVAAAEGVNV